jgi:hypothetical protein
MSFRRKLVASVLALSVAAFAIGGAQAQSHHAGFDEGL